MKIIGRISVILAAALVVVGIAFGFSQTSYAQNVTPVRENFVQGQSSTVTVGSNTAQTNADNATSTVNNVSGAPAGEFNHERSNSPSLFGIGQVLLNFIIVSLIVLPFEIVPRILRRRKEGPPGGQPPLDQATYA